MWPSQIFDELRKVGRRHDLSAGLLIGGKDVKEEQERVHGARMGRQGDCWDWGRGTGARAGLQVCFFAPLREHLQGNPAGDGGSPESARSALSCAPPVPPPPTCSQA